MTAVRGAISASSGAGDASGASNSGSDETGTGGMGDAAAGTDGSNATRKSTGAYIPSSDGTAGCSCRIEPAPGRGKWKADLILGPMALCLARRKRLSIAKRRGLLAPLAVLLLVALAPRAALAVQSAELYQTQSYQYGRFEARLQFAPGDGVVSSFFLWKSGSDMAGAYWNELDFEKLGADCHLQTNALYGAPVVDHSQTKPVAGDLCSGYHTYGFEWTPSYIAWLVDGTELRRETGDAATAFAQNAMMGMQIHFNVWPGDASFGGNFNPAVLPVREYLSWVQYSSYSNGKLVPQWRQEFDASAVPSGWALGNWASPKNHSTHSPANVTFVNGIAVLSLTSDDATGFNGMPPADSGGVIGIDAGLPEAGGGTTGGATGSSTTGGLLEDAGKTSGGTSTTGGANTSTGGPSTTTGGGSNATGGQSGDSTGTPSTTGEGRSSSAGQSTTTGGANGSSAGQSTTGGANGSSAGQSTTGGAHSSSASQSTTGQSTTGNVNGATASGSSGSSSSDQSGGGCQLSRRRSSATAHAIVALGLLLIAHARRRNRKIAATS